MTTQKNPKEICLDFLQELFHDYQPCDLAVRFWDGSRWLPDPNQKPHFTLCLNHPESVHAMFWPPTELNMAESYIFGEFDLEGDIEASHNALDYLKSLYKEPGQLLHLSRMLLPLPKPQQNPTERSQIRFSGQRHSIARDQQVIRYHYNLPSEFYGLWLDSAMIYSCAYFLTDEDDLETAQMQKLDYICRKLRLKEGERILDIGCGWGELIIHAAKHFGVNALGITLSDKQAKLARERVKAAGLEDRCGIAIRDYRDIDEPEAFDKLVSIGMFEHVGESQLPTYFQQAWKLLKPGGAFLNHGIARTVKDPLKKVSPFIDRYVFPDGELSLISDTHNQAEATGFEIRDVESLREHYTLTLRHWIRCLENHHDEAVRITNEATYRTWRLYMAGSAHRFSTGYLNVYQCLFIKQTPSGQSLLPLTRRDWYES